MSRFDKFHLAVSLVCIVCVGTALQLDVSPSYRLLPFVLALASYRAGALLTAARGGGR